jgi:signal transduction histidine kinase
MTFVSAKTLRDQVDEIEKILADAQDQLRQASYALETLKARIDSLAPTPPR